VGHLGFSLRVKDDWQTVFARADDDHRGVELVAEPGSDDLT
jgi:hypothetical protein